MVRSLWIRNDRSDPFRFRSIALPCASRRDATRIDLFFLPKVRLRVISEACGSRCPLLLNACLIR